MDQIIGKSEVADTIQQIVATTVQEQLIQQALLLPTVTDYSQFSQPGYDTVKIPKGTDFVVDDKLENNPVDAQTYILTTDDLPLDKHKVIQFIVEDKALRQSAVAIIQDAISRAVKQHALQVDKDILSQLALASSSSPDHIVAFLSNKREDILRARRLLNEAKVPMMDRTLLIGPDQEEAILNTAGFVEADKYGSTDPVMNGEIGRIFGFKVLMHTEVKVDRMIAYHKSAVAFARQLSPNFETQRELKLLGTRYSIDQDYGVKVLDGGKRQVVMGDATAY